MKDDNVIVLGTLKKEKSSKPFFVLFIFILLIGTCLAFPYIKAYLGDDFNLDDLLNRNNTTTAKPVTTTTSTTTTSEVINDDENNTFVFENIIDKEIDLSSIDVNYFVLSSNYNDVLNQLSGKGFDGK